MKLNMISTAAFALTLTSSAYGQYWVSAATGNDTNVCTRTSTCKTFQRALNIAGPWSSIGVLDPGDYGPATISEAVTIDGGGLAATVTTSGTSITVQAPAGAVVQLRNLSLHGNGASVGISYVSGAQLLVENVKVNGYGGNCIFDTSAGDMVVQDSTIDNCSGAGIWASSGANLAFVEVVNSRVHFANTAVYVSGLITATISGSSLSGTSARSAPYGVVVGGNYITQVMIDNCQISNFGYGVYANVGFIQMSRSALTYAAIGSSGSGTTIWSNGNNSLFFVSPGGITQTVPLQ